MAILGLTVSFILFTGAVQKPSPAPKPFESIVRLLNDKGQFFCSGTVIAKNMILTAAHCVEGATSDSIIEVRGANDKRVGVYGHPWRAMERADFAIIRGNFRHFDARQVETDPKVINEIFLNPNSQIVTCGYPYGGALACNRVTNIHRAAFFFAGDAYLYPGMSGGPVFDANTGKVIAENQAVTNEGQVVLSPLIELFKALDVR